MMTAPAQNIALLLFLRDEKQEARAKPLAGACRRVNRAVFRALNHHARRQARSSGLPLLVVKGAQQTGHSFGERLANAFEYAFARGYDNVIAIGNDCLALDAARLREAAQVLGDAGAVLGPAGDGGAYLIGLSRKAYHRRAFIALPWQANRLYAALWQYVRHLGCDPYLLRQEDDADDAPALRRLAGRLPSGSTLRRALEKLLAPPAPLPAFCAAPAIDLRYRPCRQRGPPFPAL
ncbi:MAG: DUF2064 domain-containing protein [Phaeodactylibacter sp.]|nr:DUF2064 domain-containing protein [Phaeodactylibacter sp.]MCB9298737.1 DUF2064 domain-containing protein [Lewinellaceae bacterium]